MEGFLSEFDLAEVLQVVGLGRQYTGVEIQHEDGRAGTIFMKSGIVVSVHAPPSMGKQAFFDMFRDGDGRFFVFRAETPMQLPEPLGPVNRLLMEAATSSAPPNPSTHRPSAPAITIGSEPPKKYSVLPFEDLEIATNAAIARPAPLPREAVAQPPARNASSNAQVPSKGYATKSVAPQAKELPNGGHPANAQAPVQSPPSATPAARPSAPPQRNAVPAVGPARAAHGDERRIIAIVSPKGGSGKTTVALNTAIALARQGHPVTLVDADVNGDILSAINSRGRAQVGTYDILEGRGTPEQGLLRTILPHLNILPAVGARLPQPETLTADLSEGFRKLLRELAASSNVIVDTPAGMFGVTRNVLTASTHVIAVLQAEVVAHRSFERFREGIAGIPEVQRPRVLGVVLNMLQMRMGASLSVLQSVCTDLPSEWLFETSIPRHPAILEATAQGVPIRNLDENAPPAVAFLFDTLAAEIAQRLKLSAVEARPQPLLL